MRIDLRALTFCLAVCSTIGLAWSPVAVASGQQTSSERSRTLASALTSALVTPGSPSEGEELQALDQTQRDNPEAVRERDASRTKYEGMSAAGAVRLDSESFPGPIDQQQGGPPPLPSGERITGFEAPAIAQVAMPGGEHSVIESLQPMAIQTSDDTWTPINLALSATNRAFTPKEPLVPETIPARLSEGTQIGPLGISIVPVDAEGHALQGSEGTLNGASVVYANTDTDADTIVTPTTLGIQADTVIRAAESPQRFFFHVQLPTGAHLIQAHDGSGVIEAIEDGQAIATIPRSSAVDAAGTPVPVSTSVSEDTVTLTIDHRAGSYDYPILLDPEFNTLTLTPDVQLEDRWNLEESALYNGFFRIKQPALEGELGLEFVPGGSYEGQWGQMTYATNGNSQVYALDAPTYKESSSGYEGYVRFVNAATGARENVCRLTIDTETVACSAEGSPGNSVSFGMEFTQAAAYGNAELHGASISIKQPKETHSTVSYNTSSPEIEGQPNVLYGSGTWLSPYQGAFEATAEDAGLGVSELAGETAECSPDCTWSTRRRLEEDFHVTCHGVQCAAREHDKVNWRSLWEAGFVHNYEAPWYEAGEGEMHFRFSARDAEPNTSSSEFGEGETILKVWSRPPHNITVTGMDFNEELGENVSHPKVEATSGEIGGKKSPGVKDIELFVDGKPVTSTGGTCTVGPCTATAEGTISGAEYSAGMHTLDVRATDFADNTAERSFKIGTPYRATPIKVGPGSVEPKTGAYSLEATDVNLSGGQGTLSVMRNYNSRNRKGGEEGPLGPQWTVSLGSLASLEVLPEGSVIEIGPTGITFFEKTSEGTYASPEGDKSLTLEAKENEKKEITEYLLKDPTQGTTTRFTLPEGAKNWMPTVSEGPVATNTTTDKYESVKEEDGKTIVRPSEELAPHPREECPSEWKKMQPGCHALMFEYDNDEGTVAKGENESEWGEYKGRLKEVLAVDYNPASGKPVRTAVAHYEYDSQGRLRAEWDPRISPALSTVYGYNPEGRVTAVQYPGEQPWLLNYGTIANDSAMGRLLSVVRPSAATKPGKGKLPENEKGGAPELSNTKPSVGVIISVSEGKWANEPLGYTYQWEDCTSEDVCSVIPGATSASYTPLVHDAEKNYLLRAAVTATNAMGSATAYTAFTSAVAGGTLTEEPTPSRPKVGTSSMWTIDYDVPLSGPGAPQKMGAEEAAAWGQSPSEVPKEATAVFPPDEPMGSPAADYKRATIYYRDSHARTVNVAIPSTAPSGTISTQEYNEANDVVRTLSAENRGAALLKGGGSTETAASANLLDTENTYTQGNELKESLGPQHAVKLKDGEEVKTARNHTRYFYDEDAPTGETYDLVTKVIDGALYEGKEVEERETVTSYSGQSGLGWKLRRPTSVTTDPSGLDLVSTTVYEPLSGPNPGQVIETRSPGSKENAWLFRSGSIRTDKEGVVELEDPGALAGGAGDIWAVDRQKGRVDEFKITEEDTAYLGEKGTQGSGLGDLNEPQGIAITSKGDLWVADTGNNRIEEFMTSGKDKVFGEKGAGPGDFDEPKGITVSHGHIWVADSGNGRIEKFTEKGAFEANGSFGTKGTAPGDLEEPVGVAVNKSGDVWVVDRGNKRVYEFTSSGMVLKELTSQGSGPGEFEEPAGIAVSSDGDVFVADRTGVEQFSETGQYISESGPERPTHKVTGEPKNKGEMVPILPAGIAVLPTGRDENMFVINTAEDRIEEWKPEPQPASIGNKLAHNSRTVYYTAEAEAEVAACRKHPEWVGLPCQTRPSAQPEVAGKPGLPVTMTRYDTWDEPETITEEFGGTTRTKTYEYDSAGRETATETKVTSSGEGLRSSDAPLPKISYTYSKKTGMQTEQSTTTSEGKTETITTEYNTLGQLSSYTDAAGNTTTYTYNEDGRLEEVNFGKVDDGHASQTYEYESTTGFLTKLVDSTAGTFTASYSPAGKMLTEGYPNGMTAHYTYNQVGQATNLEYVKTTQCVEENEKCRWFKDSIDPSSHGETLSQESTLADNPVYQYDEAGRLKEVQEIPAGEGCTTRRYTYDEEGNRTSLTTVPPGSKGACGTKKATVATHSYDTANQLIDPEVEYEALGNITRLPAADASAYEPANSKEELKSSYYVDSQLATQEQDGKTIQFEYDPAGRTLATTTSGKGTVISHYAAPGEAVAWSSEGTDEWTRNIPGIDGMLDATQHNGATPTILLHDLQGNVVATAEDNSEKETKLLSTYRSTEFGVPTSSHPPKYSWLGGVGVANELEIPSGVIAEDGVAYVPILARPLQTQLVQPPHNVAEEYVNLTTPWAGEAAADEAAERTLERQEARRALEEASGPPGSGPESGGGGYLEASGVAEGDCGGGEACASSNVGCEVHLRYGEPYGNELLAVGEYDCNQDVAHAKLEVCILVDKNGRWEDLECNHEGKKPAQEYNNTKKRQAYVTSACGDGYKYRGWTWAFFWGTGPDKELKHPLELQTTCTGNGTGEELIETLEYVTS